MAITSKFYTGSVDHVDWSKGAPNVGSLFYGAEGLLDWQPTVVPAVDRTVRINTGTIFGRGVRDVKDTTSDVAIPAVTGAAGTVRWDLIVARRTWATSVTALAVVTGTQAKAIPAGRTIGPGVVDDQPIALVKVTSGSTTITELVDLRCFGGGTAGQQVVDKLALQYLNFPGAMVQVGSEFWTFPAGASDWVKSGNFKGLDLSGASDGTLFGGVNAQSLVNNGSPFFFQAGTNVNYSDASGYARVSMQNAFPNGLLTVILQDGDHSISEDRGTVMNYKLAGRPWNVPGGVGPAFSKYDFVYAVGVTGPNGEYWRAGGRLHRVNWIAVGF